MCSHVCEGVSECVYVCVCVCAHVGVGVGVGVCVDNGQWTMDNGQRTTFFIIET